MIAALVAPLALLAPPPASGNWKATSLTAAALAAKVDRAMASVSQRLLSYQLTYHTEKEGTAVSNCKGTIVAPGVYKVQLPLIRPHDRLFIYRQNWQSDGKRFGYSVDPKLPKPAPLATRPAPPASPLSVWFVQCPTVILSGLGRPARVFQDLVAGAKQKGFKTVVQARTLAYQGRTFHSNRFILTKGPIRYEIVVDGDQFLPTVAYNTIPNGLSHWGKVHWDLPAKKLTAKDVLFTP